MIPAMELAMETGHKVVVYFPPYQYSSNLASMASSKPVQLKQYESRFKQCLLSDIVHLSIPDFDISIPQKWKNYQ